MSDLLELAVLAATDAGATILGLYRKHLTVEFKGDGSPVTTADQWANRVILDKLAISNIPVVSEECDDLRLQSRRYWLVDPLDGTKDFLAGNDEFSVNIALIVDDAPVLGVVYAPALDELYSGSVGLGARRTKAGVSYEMTTMPRVSRCRMAVSRFHDHPDVEIFAKCNGIETRVAIGSALKYGQLAANAVDVFPRLVGCSEWDTAAGQAVLEAAGGMVVDWHTGLPLRYGKTGRRNPRLLALRAPFTVSDFKLKTYQAELL